MVKKKKLTKKKAKVLRTKAPTKVKKAKALAKKSKAKSPTKSGAPEFVLNSWERGAVDRLVELLDYQILESMLGDLAYTVRKLREIDTGVSRRGSKEDMARALMIAHGTDLFADKNIRQIIAQTCNVTNPKAWHPGKQISLNFVIRCGFPRKLAGILSPDPLPDYERIEGVVRLPALEDFQREIFEELLTAFKAGKSRAIATLPTGAGKTRTAAEAIREFWLAQENYDVIWLAHTEELCEQAFQCFKEIWETSSSARSFTAFRYWGDYSRNLGSQSVAFGALLSDRLLVISTPMRLLNALTKQKGRENNFAFELAKTTRVMIIDEAHRAGAPTYKELLDVLARLNPDCSFIGLTATPYRMEGAEGGQEVAILQETFPRLIEAKQLGDKPRQRLQELGVLAALDMREVKTDVDLHFPTSSSPSRHGFSNHDREQIDRSLTVEADIPRRRLSILPYLLTACAEENSSVLYFGPTVNDAQAMAFLLRTRGVAANFVGANTRTATRQETIRQFRDGKVRVICNCEVLTTGFDAPRVTHVVIARPTVSRVLWEQMIGRGLRGEHFGGTKTCIVVDCVDNFKGDPGKIEGFLAYRNRWYGRLMGQ